MSRRRCSTRSPDRCRATSAGCRPVTGSARTRSSRTAGDASTQLLFRDETALSIGPSSEVTLDRFVFDASGSATSVAVNLSKGALRFVSGASDPRRYEVKTPLAVIGVRGIVIDVRYVDGKVYVILTEGATDVCVKGGRCVSVTRPGDAVVIGQGGTIRGRRCGMGASTRKPA